ncbi:aspartic peptidase domain-containing protein, partial [Pyrenochaeta sp. MPI-SDFR-AT-0127]
VTNNVLHLKTAPSTPHLIPPSSKHLAKRRSELTPSPKYKRQEEDLAAVQEDLITLGGRVYMTDVTLAGQIFTLVIDTGSSDTWVASSSFQCLNPSTLSPISPQYCGFNTPYNTRNSSTWRPIRGHGFSVHYTGGEFLLGDLGTEELGIGDVYLGREPTVVVRQTIGVVDEGYWLGDGMSSGLIGLAYSALVSGARTLGYGSVMYTLTKEDWIPPVFSLALSRPTVKYPMAGGMLAIGGIPDIPHDDHFVTVPIQPLASGVYAFYAVKVDGFDITPPTPEPASSSSASSKSSPRMLDPATFKVKMIFDSGSSLLYLPNAITDYIASLFDPPAKYNASSDLFIVPCNASAPRVGIIIGGKSFYIHEDDLMNKSPGAVGGPGVGAPRGMCALAVQRAGKGSLVLGDSWLKNVLVVFDLEDHEIRIAARENY